MARILMEGLSCGTCLHAKHSLIHTHTFTLCIYYIALNQSSSPPSPSPPRLSDCQEYEEQGRVETKKAVEDLRKHCRRRDDEIWDKISNLHDSKRF